MTTIHDVNNTKISFTTNDSIDNCVIKLSSGYSNEIFYTTMFEKYEKNVNYWISHPRLSLETTIKILFFQKGILYEEIIIDESMLLKNKNHIFNVLPEMVNFENKELMNDSFTEIFIDGNFEAEKKCPHIFDQVSNFIDLGGNCGFFSKYIFQKNPNSKGVIVEPNTKLKKIIDYLNKDYNLIKEFKAFNQKSGEKIKFKFTDSLINSAVSHESNIGFDIDYIPYHDSEVETISLNDIIQNFENNEFIDILKVDIEGGEKHLLNEHDINLISKKVKYLLLESHSEETHQKFNQELNRIKFEIISDVKNNDSFLTIYKNTKLVEKKILVRVDASGMGDVLCSTPTIRKISQTYSQKIDVMSKRIDVLKKNPYINKLLNYNENTDGYDEIFDTFNLSVSFNKSNSNNNSSEKPMEIKTSNFEARQLHALGVGLTLYPEELHYDFIPDEPSVKSQLINKNTLVLHVTESWPSRTWSPQKWQRLIDLIKEKTNFKICLIGRSHSELGYFGIINKNVIDLKNIDYDFTIRGENINQSDNDRESLSEMWHILNNSYGLISFDAGPIHLAGVTDSWIFQIGASVRYEKTAPYRNQSQNYKFYFIGGECKLMCASDPKYAVKEWGSINSNPYYPNCQEGYSEFKCHPTPEMIVNKIIESYSI